MALLREGGLFIMMKKPTQLGFNSHYHATNSKAVKSIPALPELAIIRHILAKAFGDSEFRESCFYDWVL
ncbi:MAG: hypothetical protein ACJAYE_000116 [Candidatus Azotimanducaceae bacterium]|jgi:hypothetical protein